MSKRKRNVTIQLPAEFIALCNEDMFCPALVLRRFIADLCGIMNWASNPCPDKYSSNVSDERDFARQYYDRVGYPYQAEWIRENVGQGKSPCSRAGNSDCYCREKVLRPR